MGKKTSANQTALAMLTRRALSRQELHDRLAGRGYPESEISSALALVERYGYQNDPDLAKSISRQAQRQARGVRWVRATLQKRGLGAQTRGNPTPEDGVPEATLAVSALERRFGAAEGPVDMKTKAKIMRFLLGRGFLPGVARQAFETWRRNLRPAETPFD